MNAHVDWSDNPPAEQAAKPPRRMLQPPKSEVRRALRRVSDLVAKLKAENAELRAELTLQARHVFFVGIVVGMALGVIAGRFA